MKLWHIVARILREQGMSYRAIGVSLGKPRQVVYAALNRDKQRGYEAKRDPVKRKASRKVQYVREMAQREHRETGVRLDVLYARWDCAPRRMGRPRRGAHV